MNQPNRAEEKDQMPPDSEFPDVMGSGGPAPSEPTKEQMAADEAAKREALAAEHAAMWANLDGKSPFDWPEDARNLYQSGCTCSLWGRSVVDMSPEQRILFVAYVDTVASDLMSQCKALAMAVEQVHAANPNQFPAPPPPPPDATSPGDAPGGSGE